jgi:hypothetical protein
MPTCDKHGYRAAGPCRECERESEIAQLRAELDREKSLNNFDAKRLKRLARICGFAYCDETDEFVLNVAGSILGQICASVECIVLNNSNLRVKAESMRVVLAAVAAKAEVTSEKLRDALGMAEKEIRNSTKGIRFNCVFCGQQHDTVEACNVCEESH